MLARAATLAADQVLMDLEDAVAPDAKDAARPVVLAALAEHDYGERVVSLRVNSVDTRWCYRDLVDVVERSGDRLATVVVPKVDGAEDVHFVDRLLRQIELARGWQVGLIGLEAQIESPQGVAHIDAIAAASPRLEALIFGPGDLAASMGLPQLTVGEMSDAYPGDVWHYVRMRILVAARANGLLAVDGPYAVLADAAGLARSARLAAALGFDAKWVIHPSQIDAVNGAFTPEPALYARAEGILDAYRAAAAEGRGAVRYEGEMIDEANRKMAESVARRGRWLGLERAR